MTWRRPVPRPGLRDIPPVESVTNKPVFQTTRIYDRNGTLLADLVDPDKGRRSIVNLNQLPTDLINATLAVEDPSFYANPGVDPTDPERVHCVQRPHRPFRVPPLAG